MAAFVFSGTLEFPDCMIIKTFIQHITLYKVELQTKFKFKQTQFIMLADERVKKKKNNWI